MQLLGEWDGAAKALVYHGAGDDIVAFQIWCAWNWGNFSWLGLWRFFQSYPNDLNALQPQSEGFQQQRFVSWIRQYSFLLFCHRPIIFGASIWPHFVWCVRNLSQLQRLQKNLIWGAERTLVLLLVYNCFSKKPQTRFNWNTYRENMENFRKCLISRRTLGISCANIVVVVFVHQVSKLKKLFASIFRLLMSCSDARRRTLLGQRRQTRAEWKVSCPKFRSYSWQNRQIHARNTSMNQYALDKFSFLFVSCTSVIRTTRIPRKQAGLTTQGRSTRFTLAFRSWSILCHGQSLCIVLGGPTNWRKNLGEDTPNLIRSIL